MDLVGLQFVEKSLIVGDDERPHLGPVLTHLSHPAGDDSKGVDVESRVGLVEDRHLGFEDRHLQDLVALLLAAGETLVEIALAERWIHLEAFHPFHDRKPQLQYGEIDALAGRERLAEEVDHRDAGDLLWVLERQEDAGLASNVGIPLGDVLTAELDRAAGDLVLGAAEQHAGQGGLARAVGAHEGVDLAFGDGQIDAIEDVDTAIGGDGAKTFDLEQGSGHGRSLRRPAGLVLRR